MTLAKCVMYKRSDVRKLSDRQQRVWFSVFARSEKPVSHFDHF